MDGFRCLRCGQCCQRVGRYFWTHGNHDPQRPFADHELLNRQANAKADLAKPDDDDPCEMLMTHRPDISTCAIQEYAGKQYKPVVCREFPKDEDGCFCSEKSVDVQGGLL